MARERLPSSDLPTGTGRFKTTAWTAVLAAKDPDDTDFRVSLESLVEAYWKPAYLFIRSKGRSHEEAKDLTQEFFALFLEKNFLRSVDREKGRFRNWAKALLARVFARLAAVCAQEDKRVYYEVLTRQFFSTTADGRRPSYKDIADELRLSEVDVTNYLHRAKHIYKDLLREEIRSYVQDDSQVEEELHDLWRSLSP
jgi:DNA-directed RNA polymerase specialized sigma24 family protein